jgi:cell division transport system ATP-binding protein
VQETQLTDVQQAPSAVEPSINGQQQSAPTPTAAPMIVFDGVTKVYDPNVVALREASFLIEKGEFVFLVGPSGSGKSTIMRLLLKELEPTNGRIIVGGRELARLKNSKVPMLRRNIGCVFQDFKLLHNRTASENVAYALKVQGESKRDIRAKVPEILALVGLSGKTNSLPDELSGGEQQRGEPRSRHVGRDHAAPLPHQPHRHHGRHGDPRPRDGGQDAQARHRA